MDRYIAELNIEHYKKLLASEPDEEKRHRVQRLLAEEEAKLRLIDGRPKLGDSFKK